MKGVVPVLTGEQSRELDRIAIQEEGIPSLGLMERAAEGVAHAVEELLAKGASSQVGALCGPGNNGGDGIAAAAILLERGYRVRAFLVGKREKMTPDTRAMEQRLNQAGGRLEDFEGDSRDQRAGLEGCGCRVDALFGVGVSRPLAGDALAAVALLQSRAGCPVVACDLPSGIHADTGKVLGAAVTAQVTVTFTTAKPGHYLEEGAEHTGDLTVVDIGIPRSLLHRLRSPEEPFLSRVTGPLGLPRRPRNSHKGTYGRVFLLAGSRGFTGAPVLAAQGAVRSGAGLVFLGVPEEIYPIVAVKCNSPMPFPLPEEDEAVLNRAMGCDVAVVGPGLGRGERSDRLVRLLLERLTCPVVLDADGINALAGHIDSLDHRTGVTVLTPHDGEFARLTGCSLPLENRLEQARDFARTHRCVLVLKGHRTITAAPDGRAWINTTGNPGMSKGGSGDVLAGILGSLLAQKPLAGAGWTAAELAAAGVYLHGQAGDQAARMVGEYGMTPDDLLARLPGTIEGQVE